jgi:transcriptional regulator with XRE-family HTH domain
MEVGSLIKEARLARGLTQEELGKLVGVQKSAIAKYESGRVVNIKRSTLQKLATALNLRGSDLIIQSNPKEAAELSARVLMDSDLRELVELYSSLNKDDKRTVQDLARRLAEK